MVAGQRERHADCTICCSPVPRCRALHGRSGSSEPNCGSHYVLSWRCLRGIVDPYFVPECADLTMASLMPSTGCIARSAAWPCSADTNPCFSCPIATSQFASNHGLLDSLPLGSEPGSNPTSRPCAAALPGLPDRCLTERAAHERLPASIEQQQPGQRCLAAAAAAAAAAQAASGAARCLVQRSHRRRRRQRQRGPALAADHLQQGGVPPVRRPQGEGGGAAGACRVPAISAEVGSKASTPRLAC